MNWFEEKFEKTDDEKDFVRIGDVHVAYVQSELYTNLTKREKRKCNKKHMIKDIGENPNLKMFYRKNINKKSNGERSQFRHVLVMYKIKDENPDEDVSSNKEFSNDGEPTDSDDEC